MRTYKIHLIRHGLTKENSKGQYIGSTDVPLSDEGTSKLLDLKKKFDYPTAGLLYTSPLLRCTQTADILYPYFTKIISKDLSECDFGAFEGKTVDELKSDNNFIKWIKGEKIELTNGCESMEHFSKRVLKAFREIVEDIIKIQKKDAIIVTHGGVIMTIFSAFGIPKSEPHNWVCNNGCGYSVRITPSLWMRNEVFEVYDKVPEKKENKLEMESMYIMDLVKDEEKNKNFEN